MIPLFIHVNTQANYQTNFTLPKFVLKKLFSLGHQVTKNFQNSCSFDLFVKRANEYLLGKMLHGERELKLIFSWSLNKADLVTFIQIKRR